MVVIIIVGILSAVALPRFLGVKDKATISTQIGEATGLAKECAAAILTDGPYPELPTLNSGLKATAGGCRGASATAPPGANVVFETAAITKDTNTKCGTDTLATTGTKICQITVELATGEIKYKGVSAATLE